MRRSLPGSVVNAVHPPRCRHRWTTHPAVTSKVRLVASSSSMLVASAGPIWVSRTWGWLTSSSMMPVACGRNVRASATASSGSRKVNPRAGATASQDWIANSPAAQDATALASRIRPPTSSGGGCSVRRRPPRETGAGFPARRARAGRRTHTPVGSAPGWGPRTGWPSVA